MYRHQYLACIYYVIYAFVCCVAGSSSQSSSGSGCEAPGHVTMTSSSHLLASLQQQSTAPALPHHHHYHHHHHQQQQRQHGYASVMGLQGVDAAAAVGFAAAAAARPAFSHAPHHARIAPVHAPVSAVSYYDAVRLAGFDSM